MPKTLLLADDNPTTQRVVELTFAGGDVRVVSVPDIDEAIAAIEASAPDLVLAAIALHGRSGYDLAAFMRRQPTLASVPLLLLAGAFEQVDQAQAHQVGADGILTKPFDTAVLSGRVRELLANGRGGAPTVHPPAAVAGAWGTALPVPDLGLTEPHLDESTDASSPGAEHASPRPEPEPVAEPHLVDETRAPEPVDDVAVVPAEPPAAPDAYFDEIDQAFAALSKSPRPPAPSLESEDEPEPEEAAPPPVHLAAPPQLPSPVPLTDAFAALLDAERLGGTEPFMRVGPTVAPQPAAAPAPQAAALDLDRLADQIAQRVLAQLSDRIVRETVRDVVGSTAERLVREEIERIRRNIT